MNQEKIQKAAAFLAESTAKRQRRNLPDDLKPANEAEAVAICEAGWALTGGDPAGWKIGAADPKARAAMGLTVPFLGRIEKAGIRHGDQTFPFADMRRPIVESEYGYRMGRDLPPRAEPYTRAEVEDAVEALLIGIEVPESRLEDDHGLAGLGSACDNGASSLYVEGKSFTDWRGIDLLGHDVVMTINGEERGRGTGAAVMGHPMDALVWFVNHMSANGRTLKAGQFVTTGSCTGVIPVKPGETCVADFGPLGKITVAFPA
ncbi:2-keto-4-pentenoate hydratase [Constrictibacter sp. MBR-5]|uniref:2-keto-4-pentenoate hydratase n=1 Tax=Constrictibacter sp. MBR-5 TaxID=3156467 RepID=UPI003396D7BE